MIAGQRGQRLLARYYIESDMIDVLRQRANIMTIQNHFAFQLVPILFDVVVFHHNHHHIYLREELVKIENLVRHNLFLTHAQGGFCLGGYDAAVLTAALSRGPLLLSGLLRS